MTQPVELPSSATRVTGQDRYGVIDTLVRRGVDRSAITVFESDDAFYWIIAPGNGRCVELTDDTEDWVGWLEGPWPFAATLHGPDGARTEINYSIDDLVEQVAEWCTAG
jgi:hypothetical protein